MKQKFNKKIKNTYYKYLHEMKDAYENDTSVVWVRPTAKYLAAVHGDNIVVFTCPLNAEKYSNVRIVEVFIGNKKQALKTLFQLDLGDIRKCLITRYKNVFLTID